MRIADAIAPDWKALTRGESNRLSGWLTGVGAETRLLLCVVTIFCGVGIYGASVGLWRSPLMASYVGVKLPCIIFITLAVNGMINGMLALLLGTVLSFRQTLQAILMSFTVFALIVGSLSPITLGMALNLPGPESSEAESAHRQLLLTHTALIAFAGIISTQKLFGILETFSGSKSIALRTLIAWLAGNLFVGAQVGYILRPIFGSPALTIEFLRPDAMQGNFYETIWWAINHSF
ncbi:hypothetical protein N8813_03685 [bacterium]|jgi:hypothetical protein|nr:hypothetical protein [bacterium]MDC0275805.1 hypothetical protein [Verrucomicrobiales bacterium]